MANTFMAGDGEAISLTLEEAGLEDSGGSSTSSSDSGSYGVRDYDADVASGPDETTGTINVDAIEADSDLATEDASEPVDPNAHVAQAGGELADGQTSDDDPTVTVNTPTGSHTTTADREVDGDQVSDPRFAVADRVDQLQNQLEWQARGAARGASIWLWVLIAGVVATIVAGGAAVLEDD